MVTALRTRDDSNGTENHGTDQSSMLSAAIKYASDGLRIVPCHSIRHGKCTCRRSDCRKPGKHPRIKDWPQRATCDATQIMKWFAKWPDGNIGVATGMDSGIIVLDFDGVEGQQTLNQLTTADPSVLRTRVHRTGSEGTHLLFKYPGFAIPNSVRLLPGMDVRGDRGLIILPPSVHQSGKQYTVTNELPIADLPESLLQKLTECGQCHKESLGVLKRVEEKQSELKQEQEKKEGIVHSMPNVPQEQIEWALNESIPNGPGRRNKQVFQLARHLQAIDGITPQIPATAFRSIVDRWHRMLLAKAEMMGFKVDGDSEETLADFRYAWSRVKHPVGKALQPVFDHVVQMETDAEVSPLVWNSLEYFSRTENRSMRLLTAVTFELAKMAGDDPFSLACDAGAFQFRRIGVMKASGNWLYRRLQNLTVDQVIACVDPGKAGIPTERRAAKYVWTWTMREPPIDEFGRCDLT